MSRLRYNRLQAVEHLRRSCGPLRGFIDIQGRLVKVLADGRMGEGFHTVSWNGRDETGRQMSSGVYFYVLQSEDLKLREKMVLLK